MSTPLACHYPCSTQLVHLHDDYDDVMMCPKCGQWYKIVVYSGGSTSAQKITDRGALPECFKDVTFDPL